jgi:hypothetical protein
MEAIAAYGPSRQSCQGRKSPDHGQRTPPRGTENYLAADQRRHDDRHLQGPLTNDLLGGHIAVAFNTLGPAMGNIQSGLLRVLAVAGPKRSGLLPEVPTAEQSGLPGFEAAVRYGLLAPARTPRPIMDRINEELQAIAPPRAASRSQAHRRTTPPTSRASRRNGAR